MSGVLSCVGGSVVSDVLLCVGGSVMSGVLLYVVVCWWQCNEWCVVGCW